MAVVPVLGNGEPPFYPAGNRLPYLGLKRAAGACPSERHRGSGRGAGPVQPVRVAGLSLVVGPPARPVRTLPGDERRTVQQLLSRPPGDVEALSVQWPADQFRLPVPRHCVVRLAGLVPVDPHPHILAGAGHAAGEIRGAVRGLPGICPGPVPETDDQALRTDPGQIPDGCPDG